MRLNSRATSASLGGAVGWNSSASSSAMGVQAVKPAAFAPETGDAMLVDAAGEELPKLVFHEAR